MAGLAIGLSAVLSEFDDLDVTQLCEGSQSEETESVVPVPHLDDELMGTILGNVISSGLLGEQARAALTKTDKSSLCKALQWLLGCFPSRPLMRVSSREAVWSAYHKAAVVNLASVATITGHRQAAALISLEAMKNIVSKTLQSAGPSASGSAAEAQQVSPEECDILHYIAGYLLFRFSKFEEATQLSQSGDRGSDLLEAYDRGGLTRPNAEFVDFVVKMEEVLRKMPLRSVDVKLFRKSLDECGVLALFDDLIKDVETSDQSKARFYNGVCQLFFTVRAHQKCRHFMAQYRSRSETNVKALRDKLATM